MLNSLKSPIGLSALIVSFFITQVMTTGRNKPTPKRSRPHSLSMTQGLRNEEAEPANQPEQEDANPLIEVAINNIILTQPKKDRPDHCCCSLVQGLRCLAICLKRKACCGKSCTNDLEQDAPGQTQRCDFFSNCNGACLGLLED